MRSFILATLVMAGCVTASAQSPRISFRDASAASGLTVSHVSAAENRYIIESMSGGAAVFDCDEDGFLDIATVNGSSVDNYKAGGDLFITLYRQVDGASSKTPKFENITEAAGLKRKGWGMAVTAVDLDGDGKRDLFVTGYGGNAVYRAVGNCRYEDVTGRSGLQGKGFMTGAAWSDYDRDGDLDVFVPGYVSVDINKLPVFGGSATCSYKGIRVQCGPRGLPGESDHFFINRGDGTFEESSEKVGVADKKQYYGLGAVFGDFDNDGWQDIYVANDSSPNYLYRNKRDGTFADVSFESGTSYSGSGEEQGSMGVAFGDYDNDGNLDIFTTNFENEQNTLYRNLGARGFMDTSAFSGVAQPSKPLVGWGTSFIDLDNDGFVDLLVANGHVYPQMELVKSDSQTGFRQPFLLHRNLGNGKFEDVTRVSGLRELPLFSSRGAAFGDLNNDGLVDVVVTNLGDKPLLLMNTTVNQNKRVTFRLTEAGKNRDAIGSRMTVKTDTRTMMQEVQAGGSYLSQNDLRLHFGFGAGEKIESVEIRWADGTTTKFAGLEPGRMITISKERGIIESQEYRRE